MTNRAFKTGLVIVLTILAVLALMHGYETFGAPSGLPAANNEFAF